MAVKSFIIGVCAVCLGIFAAPAMAQDKPWTDADETEFRSLSDDILPIMNGLNEAIAVMYSDQPKSCTLLQATNARFDAMQVKQKALRARLTAEGKSVEALDGVDTKMSDLKQSLPNLMNDVCGGKITAGSLEEEAFNAELITRLGAYSNAMTQSLEALNAGDQAGFCRHGAEASAALEGLLTFVTAAREKAPTPAEQQQYDEFIANLQDQLEKNKTERFAECAA